MTSLDNQRRCNIYSPLPLSTLSPPCLSVCATVACDTGHNQNMFLGQLTASGMIYALHSRLGLVDSDCNERGCEWEGEKSLLISITNTVRCR